MSTGDTWSISSPPISSRGSETLREIERLVRGLRIEQSEPRDQRLIEREEAGAGVEREHAGRVRWDSPWIVAGTRMTPSRFSNRSSVVPSGQVRFFGVDEADVPNRVPLGSRPSAADAFGWAEAIEEEQIATNRIMKARVMTAMRPTRAAPRGVEREPVCIPEQSRETRRSRRAVRARPTSIPELRREPIAAPGFGGRVEG